MPLTIDSSNFSDAIRRLAKLPATTRKHVLESFGEYMQRELEDRAPWKGARNDFDHKADPDRVVIGTRVPWGRIRHYGGTIGIGGTMSPEADLNTGGASYFFTRIKSARSANKTPGVVWKADQLKRMDSISYGGDFYGKVSDGADAIRARRKAGVEAWRAAARSGNNETIFKGGLSLFDDLEAVVVRSEKERKAVIDVFRKHGWEKLPDGRSVEDIVKLAK